MTHNELLAKIDNFEPDDELDSVNSMNALRAVVELLQGFNNDWMLDGYQNSYLLLAIKEAIEKELG